jgi:hypothetical protein
VATTIAIREKTIGAIAIAVQTMDMTMVAMITITSAATLRVMAVLSRRGDTEGGTTRCVQELENV